jgi:antitoxin ParD1/3/4
MPRTLTIPLSPEAEGWLAAQVADGTYASMEEAATAWLENRAFENEFAEDDFAWAKPLIDEALASAARGECITLAEHRARNRARLALLAAEVG